MPKHLRAARTGFWLSLFRFQGATGHTPEGVGAVLRAHKEVDRSTLRSLGPAG